MSGRGVRIPVSEYRAYRIEMGKQILNLYPDPGVSGTGSRSRYDFILFDPQRYFSGIAHWQRITPGETLSIDRQRRYQEHVFSSPRDAFRRHLSISHKGDTLEFRDPISELGTYVVPVVDHSEIMRLDARRIGALQRILEIFGGVLEPLSADDAITVLRQVNRVLRDEAWRRQDSFGNPGGYVELPGNLTPILVGDLHARLDNLLKILSENAFMEALDNGTAVLVILGDAVHPEEEGKLEQMDSSLLMMDLIFKLKLRFPAQVFYIVGNHDSFSHDIMKQGVPQGLHWDKQVTESRGPEYRAELELFYRQSPLAVISPDFIACHAGPVRKKISLESLANIRQFPELVHEMTWSRLQTTSFPTGYTRSDVSRFRKGLEVGSETPFIVGHHPCTRDGTLWLDAGHIRHFHVVISSRTDRIGLFTRIDGRMVPQIYPAEDLSAWLNERFRATVSG
ncbi:MAG: metallophosphoesterase [Gammaproteobacteria bacterium]